MRKKDENVVPFPGAAEDANDRAYKALQIETVMNNIGSITTLIHETVEGERFMAARAWLAEQLDINFGALDELLQSRGA